MPDGGLAGVAIDSAAYAVALTADGSAVDIFRLNADASQWQRLERVDLAMVGKPITIDGDYTLADALGFTAIAAGDNIIILTTRGGASFDPETEETKPVTANPALADSGAVAAFRAGNKVAVLASLQSDDGTLTRTVETSYDPSTDTWSASAPIPVEGYLVGAAATADHLVAWVDDGTNTARGFRKRFDVAGWNEVASPPGDVRLSVGTDPTPHIVGADNQVLLLTDHVTASYRPNADSWVTGKTMPNAAVRLQGSLIWNEELLVFGGGPPQSGFAPEAQRRDGLRYSPEAAVWRPLTTMPVSPNPVSLLPIATEGSTVVLATTSQHTVESVRLH